MVELEDSRSATILQERQKNLAALEVGSQPYSAHATVNRAEISFRRHGGDGQRMKVPSSFRYYFR